MINTRARALNKLVQTDGDSQSSSRSSSLSLKSLRLTMNNLGEPVTEAEVHSMILEADLDGDGKINFSEFKMLMATKLNDV